MLRKPTLKTHDGIFPKQSGLALPKVVRGLCEGFSVAVYLFASEITLHLRDYKNCVEKGCIFFEKGQVLIYMVVHLCVFVNRVHLSVYVCVIRMIMCVQSRCRFCTIRFRQQHLVQKDGHTGV